MPTHPSYCVLAVLSWQQNHVMFLRSWQRCKSLLLLTKNRSGPCFCNVKRCLLKSIYWEDDTWKDDQLWQNNGDCMRFISTDIQILLDSSFIPRIKSWWQKNWSNSFHYKSVRLCFHGAVHVSSYLPEENSTRNVEAFLVLSCERLLCVYYHGYGGWATCRSCGRTI